MGSSLACAKLVKSMCNAATRQTFKEQEALVYQQLAQLIKDAVWLKSYLAAVMRLEQEAFAQAYVALGVTKATPMMHPHVDVSAMPATPEHTGMIPASRPSDTPPQVIALRTERHAPPKHLQLYMISVSQKDMFWSLVSRS